MLGSIDWNAVGAVAGVIGAALVVGGAVVKVVQNWIGDKRVATKRLDRLEIRLFGLPADPDSGAKAMPGEFDRIDKRLDDLPDQIISALKDA